MDKDTVVTDKEARNAVNTIIEYCEQRHKLKTCCVCHNCGITDFCDELYKVVSGGLESWKDLRDYPLYVDEEDRLEEEKKEGKDLIEDKLRGWFMF